MSLQHVLFVEASSDDASFVPVSEALWETLAQEPLLYCQRLQDQPLLDQIVQAMPDLVIFLNPKPSVPQCFQEFLQELRLAFQAAESYRPVLLVLAEALSEKTVEAFLLAGADDVLSSTLSLNELRVRIMVHLRRNLELLTEPITGLPSHELTNRQLLRCLQQKTVSSPNMPWALVALTLSHFEAYTDIYGHLASNQVLKTLAAMLRRLTVSQDFIGYSTENNTFWILTHPDRAEKLAALLCRQFETVVANFYADRDKKRGYLVSVVDRSISQRVPFLSLSLGIVDSTVQRIDTSQQAYTVALQLARLAQNTPGSQWVSDRLKLSGECLPCKAPGQGSGILPGILVVEEDAALALLLKTALEMEHYTVYCAGSAQEAWQLLQQESLSDSIRLVLLDAVLHGETMGWQLAEQIKAQRPDRLVMFLSTLHDRDRAMATGADLYLPKPFELSPLLSWVKRLLKTF